VDDQGGDRRLSGRLTKRREGGWFGSFPAGNYRGGLPRGETLVEVSGFDATPVAATRNGLSGRVDNKIARRQVNLRTSVKLTLGKLDKKIAKNALARHRGHVEREMSCDRAGWMLGFP
jgi:hypothetical protein